MIEPLFSYANVAWQSICTKECLTRILKLQKRAGRVILSAEPSAPSVPLFNKLGWLPLYIENDIAKCALLYKRTQMAVPTYLIESLKLNSASAIYMTVIIDSHI